MARPVRQPPSALVDNWPDEPADDPVVEAARRFAIRLATAIEGQSVRSVARRTGVDRTVIASILGGYSWPDIATLARLEVGLAVKLWCADP